MSKIHGIKSTQHPLWLFSSQRRATCVLFCLWLTHAWWFQATPFASYETRVCPMHEAPLSPWIHDGCEPCSLRVFWFCASAHQVNTSNDLMYNAACVSCHYLLSIVASIINFSTYPLLGVCLLTTYTIEHMRLFTRVYSIDFRQTLIPCVHLKFSIYCVNSSSDHAFLLLLHYSYSLPLKEKTQRCQAETFSC